MKKTKLIFLVLAFLSLTLSACGLFGGGGNVSSNQNEDTKTQPTESKPTSKPTEPSSTAHIHDYQLVEHTDPSFTYAGVDVYRCSECGASYQEVIPIKEHTYSEDIIPKDEYSHGCQCTDEGYDYLWMNIESHTFGDVIVDVPATATVEGKGHQVCEGCGYSKEVSVPHEHTLGSYGYNDSYHWTICEECGKKYGSSSLHEMDYNYVIEKEPTEEEYGSKYCTCTVCGYKQYTQIPKIAHVHNISETLDHDDNNHFYYCTKCNEHFDEEAHDFSEWDVGPNTAEGITKTRTCSVCGYVQKEVEDHYHVVEDWTYSDYITVKDDNGFEISKTGECTICGESVVENVDVYSKEYITMTQYLNSINFDAIPEYYAVFEVPVDYYSMYSAMMNHYTYRPTYYVYKSDRASADMMAYGIRHNTVNKEFIDITYASGYSNLQFVTIATEDTDETVYYGMIAKTGNGSARNTRLYYINTYGLITYAALGLDMNSMPPVGTLSMRYYLPDEDSYNQLLAGLKSSGSPYYISYEDEISYGGSSEYIGYDDEYHWGISRNTGKYVYTTEKYPHEFDEGTVHEPTFEDDGYTEYKCECGYSYHDNSVPHLEHNHYDDIYHDENNHWYLCSDEGYEELKVGEEPHNYEEWIIDTPAQMDIPGLKHHVCADCGYSEEEIIPALPHVHSYSNEWTIDEDYHWHAATCVHTEEKGDLAEHDYDEWIIDQAAIMDYAGSKHRICKVCGYREDAVIPALPHVHSYSEEWSNDANTHWHDNTCTICEEHVKSSQAYHTFGSPVVHEPTLTEQGYTSQTCSVCGYERIYDVLPSIEFSTVESLNFEDKGSYMRVTGFNGTPTELVIPRTYNDKPVTSISTEAFKSCTSLVKVTFIESENEITLGQNVFRGCNNLEEVNLSGNIKVINSYTFYNCNKLKSITFPEGVTELKHSAIMFCDLLEEINVPSTMTKVFNGGDMGGLGVYNSVLYTPKLHSVNVASENTKYTSVDGILYNKDVTKVILVPADRSGEDIVFPNTVTEIQAQAFFNTTCNSVTIPEGMTTFSSNTFDAAKIGTLILPSTFTTISSGIYCDTQTSDSRSFGVDYLVINDANVTFADNAKFVVRNDIRYGKGNITLGSKSLMLFSTGYAIFPSNVSFDAIPFSYSIYANMNPFSVCFTDSEENVTLPTPDSWGDSFSFFYDVKEIYEANDMTYILSDKGGVKTAYLLSCTASQSYTTFQDINYKVVDGKCYIKDEYEVTGWNHDLFKGHRYIDNIHIPLYMTELTASFYVNPHVGYVYTLSYDGTVDQWNALVKESGWKSQVNATYVTCSNGKVDL